MTFAEELHLLFRSRIPVVNVVTYDEGHVLRELEHVTAHLDDGEHGLYSWDIADGFVCHRHSRPEFDIKKKTTPDTILTRVDEHNAPATFVLTDFHHVWEAKKTPIRKLRNLARELPQRPRAVNLVLITPTHCLPPELKQDVAVLECPKPDAEAMDAVLQRIADEHGEDTLRGVTDSFRDKVVESALGLSATQAERVFRKAFTSSRRRGLDEGCIDLIVDEKRAIIRESGALELYPQVEGIDQVGGLDELKTWLGKRRGAFSEAARAYGLDQPKGVALIGIPGTGKSLCAKVTAGLWQLPLLRLDMGAVFGGVLGSSERNIRDAIEISEIIAPCVLWVDEIEKAFAGSGGDSGTAARVLATFLTWMQEKTSAVFVFATANDESRLPPEFLRKGRFDEVFFLDLPTEEERRAIFEVHLRRKNQSMIRQRFELPAVADATKGFVGAEIEAVVKDAMFSAFMDEARELETDDLLRSVGDMVPLAKSRAEDIERLRRLVLSGQARNASKLESEVAIDDIPAERGRYMDL